MKINARIYSGLAAVLCGALPALAQHAATNDVNSFTNSVNNDAPDNRPALGKLEKANVVIGREVTDAQHQRLGSVKDLAIDLQNGRLVEVIVGTGGVLGFDQHYTAVPPDQFTCDAQTDALQLNADQAKLKAAPTFDLSDWNSGVEQARVSEAYNYFGSHPYFAAGGQVPIKTQPRPVTLGEVQRADKVIGTEVRNLQDQKIGKVENLMVDLSSGRVVEVVLGSGGFLGIDNELSAVPPQSFRPGTNDLGTLVLDTSKEAFASAPHFKPSDWGTVNDVQHVQGVYGSYKVEPYFTTNAADNTAQNIRDRNGDTATPIHQGTSTADMNTTQQIRKALIAAENLSVDARNIKVITLDGHVTLRGPVKSDEEKRRIESIAESVTPAANIDNQLQVVTPPTASVQ